MIMCRVFSEQRASHVPDLMCERNVFILFLSSLRIQEVYRGSRTACSVEGLHFNTEYRARVKAFNRVGYSAPSGVVRLHTAERT